MLRAWALILALALFGTAVARAAETPPPRATIEGAELTVLIRETLSALNQANRTGNYTVLRDLGSQAFRDVNDAATLAATFSSFRTAGIDMARALVAAPSLTSNPMMDGAGRLHLVGYVSTAPQKIRYRLIFLRDGARWQLAGLAVKLDRETDAALVSQTVRELRRAR